MHLNLTLWYFELWLASELVFAPQARRYLHKNQFNKFIAVCIYRYVITLRLRSKYNVVDHFSRFAARILEITLKMTSHLLLLRTAVVCNHLFYFCHKYRTPSNYSTWCLNLCCWGITKPTLNSGGSRGRRPRPPKRDTSVSFSHMFPPPPQQSWVPPPPCIRH